MRADRDRTGRVGRDGRFGVGPGADKVDLAVDAERGALLRSEAFLDGEPFRRLEVTEISFGPIHAETIELVFPGCGACGRMVSAAQAATPRAGAAAPFPVLVPDRVPDGWRLVESLFTAGRAQPPIEPQVFVSYGSREGAYVVAWTCRVRNPTPGVARVARDGDVALADAGEHVEPRHHVRVELEGTVVELAGTDPTLLARPRALARTRAAGPRRLT